MSGTDHRKLAARGTAEIDPVLKAWIDNVLVPVMVREYLDSRPVEVDNGLSPEDSETPMPERFQ
jgi:hypothetical protein